MTEKEKVFFDALNKHRSKCADVLEETCMSGIQNSVVEKYTDQAHFIYELLQNADDAGATTAEFNLCKDRLIFKHNGTRRFFVTDPAKEAEDTKNGTLGDLNSITSVANSNKQHASIGKFGVGFKAVFQYTQTPHIYDPNVRFRIERFIVPIELVDDFTGRKGEETVFVFPFDHEERNADEAFDDISEKLRNLTYPIFFLNNLKYISFGIDSVIGLYGIEIVSEKIFDDISARLIKLSQNEGDNIYDENLWLFTRHDIYDRNYSVGFFMDEEGNLKPCNMYAFCFFPTKEVTNLNFIVHAPFLLTDSREGIKAGERYNKDMIQLLSSLASDSLACLRDIGNESGNRIINDSILDIVPIDESNFTQLNDRNKISFLPFYSGMQEALKSGLLPTKDGYVSYEEAYWSDTLDIYNLFTDKQLSDLLKTEAKWVFCSYGRNTTGHNAREGLQDYIDSLTADYINESDICRNIDKEFISNQPLEWLHSFYKWISETPRRFTNLKSKAIFIDSNNNVVSAYDGNGQKTLFLPSHANIDCPTVNFSLLENEKTKAFFEDVVKLEEPSLKDYIYNYIIPQYEKNDDIDTDPHFMLFFKYYKLCPQEEVDEFIGLIKNCEFITYYDEITGQLFRGKASELYYPSAEIKQFFVSKQDAHFVAYDEYLNLAGESNKVQLDSFLFKLGIKNKISILSRQVNYSEAISRKLPRPHSSRARWWEEGYIDGCVECIDMIISNQDKKQSVMLWSTLLQVITENCKSYTGLDSLLCGKCHYFYYSSYTQSYESLNTEKLKNERWLVDRDGSFVAANDITKEKLSLDYDLSNKSVTELLSFLGLYNEEDYEDLEEISNLSEKQKERIELAKRAEQLGLTIDDLEEFAKLKKDRDAISIDFNESRESLPMQSPGKASEDNNADDNQTTGKSRVIQDISRRTKAKPSIDDISFNDVAEEENDTDEDEFTPRRIDYSKKIELAKQKSASEIDKIVYLEELQKKVEEEEKAGNKYSFAWFKSLLELETLNSNQNNLNSREVSITFSKVEREPGTQRTVVLKYPNRYIPQFMEDLSDIPTVLDFGDYTKTIAIEVVNIKSYILRAKLKANANNESIDFESVKEVRIDAKSPVFILEELRRAFMKLEYSDDFNMQKNLCENIEFIFGPPGTGKTTHLAKNVLLPLMSKKVGEKVLVLTPTNKAADVLVSRIIEVMGNDKSYNEWLVRFGITNDETIEDSEVFRDKTFDIRTLNRNVTITTIARFPYDFFMPGNERIALQGLNWDYIVVDEASMIPIANIVYTLYKKTPKKFIISGDPFQIEPITAVDLWKTENIFKMVTLDSFIEPVTIPYKYKVTTLTTQYRSFPDIGNLFSRLTYGGILEHHRTADSKKLLNIENILDLKALNVIKYPVSKYESIYRCKRLQHSSSYQIYAALFSYEFTCFLAEKIAKANTTAEFSASIGIIAPYRAQADLIEKLVESAELPKNIDIQVGTIHGFQGDECDIIIAVFNTPPIISSSGEMFLNKKNIINVSISRARDYLFVIMPDNQTENINNLKLVKRVEALAKEIGALEYVSSDLEQLMFGSKTFIEDNAFATGHQNVNVYGLPEKYYEIRSEDTAVDIQIHKAIYAGAINSTALVSANKENIVKTEDVSSVNPAFRSTDEVYSAKYGKGKITKREKKDGKTYITVKFAEELKSFDEELAFKTKGLIYC